MKNTLCCIGFLLIMSCISVFAQNFRQDYEKGKTELRQKNYTKALEYFKNASVDKPANAYRVSALYFSAWCSYQLKQYWSVNHYLTKIQDKYPEWVKMDEVHYLLAALHFEKRQFQAAVLESNRITSKYFENDVENLKWQFLNFPSYTDTLQVIQKKIPQDTVIARILYLLLEKQPDLERKKEVLAKKIRKQYGFEKEDEKKEPIIKSEPVRLPKDTLRLAVLLPFCLSENSGDNVARTNQFVFDLYSGIRHALDTLKKATLPLQVVVYDTEKDSSRFATFLDMPELKSFDLFIGPLYSSHMQKAARFALENKIVIINPLANNTKLAENNPYVYLLKPSLETIGQAAARFASTAFKPSNAVVLQGRSARDSVVCSHFAATYPGKITFRKTVSPSNLATMESFLKPRVLDSVGVIFISTKDQMVSANLINRLSQLNKTTPLLTHAEWLDFHTFSYEQFQKQQVHFIYPEYVDRMNDTTRKVQAYLFRKTNILPSTYTNTGFDLMMYLGKLSQKSDFREKLNLREVGTQPGMVYKGISFQYGQDNSCVPFYHFEDNQFKEATVPGRP